MKGRKEDNEMESEQLSGEKKAISDKIDSMREGLVSLSHDIHRHP